MKLLILTQAVDTNDLALGFFHRWLEEFAKKFESIEVVCLKEGHHVLPKNVSVHSLGKPASKFTYILNFYRYVFSLQYDAVFVHMNEEYVLLGGWWWWLAGKKVVLWRNHKMGSWRTRLAVCLSKSVCYTSPEAFTARYKKAVQMPVGIDTVFFAPGAGSPAWDTILLLGRIDPVKKVEVFVGALGKVSLPFKADMYGSPTEAGSAYAKKIAEQAQPLVQKGVLALHSGVPHERTRALYQSHAIYVNLTPSGSFDKTIGEAMASGCVVVCANEALRGILSDALIAGATVESAGAALQSALSMGGQERDSLSKRLRSYVEREHSLRLLAARVQAILEKK
jgi:glycosyltransferase involved in cell wall biosynthesis